MADVIVYDPHAMNMDLGLLREEFDALPDYPQKDFDFQLMVLIAEYANGKGVCWPGMGTLAARLHCFKMDVKRGVDRLLKFGFFTVKKVKSKGAKWEHNVYVFAKRFLRKTVDKLAAHFDTAKWKTWVEEKLSERARKKLVNRYCEQADLDLEKVCASEGWWMARRYVAKHVGETPEEYDQILQEAIARYRDYDGPLYREIADRPVKRVPVMEKPAGERIVTSASAASERKRNASIVSAAEPEPVDPEPWLQDWDKPIEWEDGSQWSIAQPKQDNAPVQEPVEQETSLETLPANTESASAVSSANTTPANTLSANTQPIQLDTVNAPKFINGEVSSLWTSQQLLHKMNPDMYPAY